MRLGWILVLLGLAACAKESLPPVDSYCVKIERKDFTDPGLRAQNPANKRADIANENTWLRDCSPPDESMKRRPRGGV